MLVCVFVCVCVCVCVCVTCGGDVCVFCDLLQSAQQSFDVGFNLSQLWLDRLKFCTFNCWRDRQRDMLVSTSWLKCPQTPYRRSHTTKTIPMFLTPSWDDGSLWCCTVNYKNQETNDIIKIPNKADHHISFVGEQLKVMSLRHL